MKPENFPQNPEHLWSLFYDFTQTPRPSRKEEKIVAYLIELAKKNSLKYVVDAASNVIIYVPGKNGRENEAPVIIQNHIDMVTDALHSVEINFATDPILTKVEGEWLKAQGTTLGADNGIGCAAALATIFEKDMIHPPLELLFTVDEETGLNGALGFEHKYLQGRKMLNLDTEEWGSLYIGCAGGIDYELTKDIKLESTSLEGHFYKLQVEKFIGGHSGVDIHEQRGNALKFLGELLDKLRLSVSYELAEIRGGKAHNIIPRDSFAIIKLASGSLESLKKIAQDLIVQWKSFTPKNDQDFDIVIEEVSPPVSNVLSRQDKNDVIDYMNLFPHGAHAYNVEVRELVSISNNFAKFLVVNGKVYTQSSLRFFDREEVRGLERKVQLLGKMFDMKVENHSEYPSWKPALDNPILDLVRETYQEIYGEIPHVTAIHAGLECGILRDKIGPIDVLSFGPTITGAHSPDESVHIPSVEKFWDLFKAVLIKI
jgi:dipeptidase D